LSLLGAMMQFYMQVVYPLEVQFLPKKVAGL